MSLTKTLRSIFLAMAGLAASQAAHGQSPLPFNPLANHRGDFMDPYQQLKPPRQVAEEDWKDAQSELAAAQAVLAFVEAPGPATMKAARAALDARTGRFLSLWGQDTLDEYERTGALFLHDAPSVSKRVDYQAAVVESKRRVLVKTALGAAIAREAMRAQASAPAGDRKRKSTSATVTGSIPAGPGGRR